MSLKPYISDCKPVETNIYIIETNDIKKMIMDKDNVITEIILKRKYGNRKRKFQKL
jgi:hypothetical protein